MRKQAITLGRVGILLPIAVIIPMLGSLAGLAALVLLLISHYNFSKVYEKPEIFKKSLTGTIIIVVGNIVGGALLGAAIFSGASQGNMQEFEIQNLTSLIFESGLTIVGFIVMLAAAIVGFYFLFQALKVLAAETGVNYFRTAGMLYFIGAIASIILIGGLVVLIGWILHIIAYFTIQPEEGASEAQPQ
ncbi:MAG: DUF996 domain-containing protein [Marinilabilia sp.]